MSFLKEEEDMSEAKLRSHVPKFGDWDNDDLPYTTYFENARKEKAGKIMNPNDPEENPEAFMFMRGGQESNYDHAPFAVDYNMSDLANKHRPNAGKIMNPNDPEENPEAFMYMRGGLESNYNHHQHDHVPLAADSSKSKSADNHRPNSANRNGSVDHQRSARRQKNTRPESGSEIGTGSDSTHLNHHRRTSSGMKNVSPGGGSFSSSVSGQSHRNGNYEYKHQRTTSVPKFGEWDETDPTSGAGFTVIFDKVKEEKHAPPASSFATVAPEVKTMNYSDSHHSKCPTPSWGSKSKICCCLF